MTWCLISCLTLHPFLQLHPFPGGRKPLTVTRAQHKQHLRTILHWVSEPYPGQWCCLPVEWLHKITLGMLIKSVNYPPGGYQCGCGTNFIWPLGDTKSILKLFIWKPPPPPSRHRSPQPLTFLWLTIFNSTSSLKALLACVTFWNGRLSFLIATFSPVVVSNAELRKKIKDSNICCLEKFALT